MDLTDRTDDGDDAHRLLVAHPKLRGLTWEQDLTARQFAKGLDFLKAAPRIVQEAELMTNMDAPGKFVRSWYVRLIAETDSGKKETGPREPAYVPMAQRGNG